MDNKKEVVHVSDWSQKYKLVIYLASAIVIIYGIGVIVEKLNTIIELLS